MDSTQPVTEGLNGTQTSAPDPFFSVLHKRISMYEECMKDYVFLFLLKICCAKNAPVGPKWKGIIELFGLERIFKDHLVQTTCNEQEHLQQDQAAQSSIQTDLEYFKGWGIHHISE